MSSNATPTWQQLSYSTVYKFARDACEDVLSAFRNDPNIGSASTCHYDFDDEVFEISCLTQDAQKALAALAQIVNKYTLQETTNVEQFEDYGCKIEKYGDSIVDLDLVVGDKPAPSQEQSARAAYDAAHAAIQESWTCQFENSDVTQIATDEVLSEIGQLTGCALTRHPSAKGVIIRLGPVGDIQAARRKLFTLEWCHHREKAITHVLKIQKTNIFELRFEQLKRIHDGSLGRTLVLPESPLQGQNVYDLTCRYLCRYYKFDRIQQQYCLHIPDCKPLGYHSSESVAQAMDAVQFRDIGDDSPGPTEMVSDPMPTHPGMKNVRDWIQGIPDVVNPPERPFEAARVRRGIGKGTDNAVAGAEACVHPTKPRNGSSFVGTTSGPNPSTKMSNDLGGSGNDLRNPQVDLHQQNSSTSANRTNDGVPDVDKSASLEKKPDIESPIPARTFEETPPEDQPWAKTTPNHLWTSTFSKHGNSGTGVPQPSFPSGWAPDLTQTTSASLIDFDLPRQPDGRKSQSRSTPQPPKRSLRQAPKARPPVKSSNVSSYNMFSELSGLDFEPNSEIRPTSVEPQQADSLIDADLDQLAMIGNSKPDYTPAFRLPLSRTDAKRPSPDENRGGNVTDKRIHMGPITEQLIDFESAEEKKTYRRSMRQQAPAPSIHGKADPVHSEKKKKQGNQFKGLNALKSLKEGGIPNDSSSKQPKAASRPTEMLISITKAKDMRNKKNLPCRDFRYGTCPRSMENCLYAHTFESLPPCTKFLKGQCAFGKNCTYPHILDGKDVNAVERAGSSVAHKGPPQLLEVEGISTKTELLHIDSPTNPSDVSSEPKVLKPSKTTVMPEDPPLIGQAPKSFINGMVKALEQARSFRGSINVEMQIGRIVLPDVTQDIREDLSPQGFSTVLSRIDSFGTIHGAFTNLLTTSASDVDFVLEVAGFSAKASPYHVEATFEFVCETDDKAQVRVMVDAMKSNESRDPYVSLGETMIGGVYLHAPQRIWDARLLVSGSVRVPVDRIDGAQALTDSLFVRMEDSNKLPSVLARDGDGLRVITVRLHTVLRYSSGVSSPINLQMRRVHELQIMRPETTGQTNRGLFHAVRLGDDAAMADEQLLWYEVSLRLVQHPSQFCENEGLELGEEAGWRVEDVVEESALRHLEDLATLLVERLDDVGFRNKGPAWMYETKKSEAVRSVLEMPDQFW